MSEINVGDKIVVIRGSWKAYTMLVKHISKNGKYVFTDYSYGLRFKRKNVEPIVKEVGE